MRNGRDSMMYIILGTTSFIFVACIALLFFVRRRPTKKEENLILSPVEAGNITNATQPPTIKPLQPISYTDYMTSQQAHREPNYQIHSDSETNRANRSGFSQRPSPIHNNMQGYPNASVSTRSQAELNTPSYQIRSSSHPLNEREQEYERGMQATHDERLGATHLVITNVVMKTPADVALAFQICTRKIQTANRQRGLDRAALLVDIAGLTIGGDATTAWGQSVKTCWDTVCIKVDKDRYLAAHYNSQASRPDREQLQEKVRRIQFMTAAVLNDFQSNIFDTREEATAFLQRTKELAGRY